MLEDAPEPSRPGGAGGYSAGEVTASAGIGARMVVQTFSLSLTGDPPTKATPKTDHDKILHGMT